MPLLVCGCCVSTVRRFAPCEVHVHSLHSRNTPEGRPGCVGILGGGLSIPPRPNLLCLGFIDVFHPARARSVLRCKIYFLVRKLPPCPGDPSDTSVAS